MFFTGSSFFFFPKVEILFSDISMCIVVIYLKYSVTFQSIFNNFAVVFRVAMIPILSLQTPNLISKVILEEPWLNTLVKQPVFRKTRQIMLT